MSSRDPTKIWGAVYPMLLLFCFRIAEAVVALPPLKEREIDALLDAR